jgi:hypothetical protein
VREISAVRKPHPNHVWQDWSAWLPDDSAQLFEHLRRELSVSCAVLAVILNEALGLSPEIATPAASELAPLFAGLFERSVNHLTVVLNALEAHGRQWGTLPSAAPLRPEDFRNERARRMARNSQLRARMLRLAKHPVCWPKLRAIRLISAGLQVQAQNAVREISRAKSSNLRVHWALLETLQYDLNTCLQETTVVLKSFFCVLPGSQLAAFRSRLPA